MANVQTDSISYSFSAEGDDGTDITQVYDNDQDVQMTQAHTVIAPSASFSVLAEASIGEQRIVHAKWSPTMDLIAIVTEPATLTVRRLNWQPLFSSHIEPVGSADVTNEQIDKAYAADSDRFGENAGFSSSDPLAPSANGDNEDEEEEDEEEEVDWSKFKSYAEWDAWNQQKAQEKEMLKAQRAAERLTKRDTLNLEDMAARAAPGTVLVPQQSGSGSAAQGYKASSTLVRCLEWRPDSRVIAVGLSTGAVALYSTDLGQRIAWIQAADRPVLSLAWSASDRIAHASPASHEISADPGSSDPLIHLKRITRDHTQFSGFRGDGSVKVHINSKQSGPGGNSSKTTPSGAIGAFAALQTPGGAVGTNDLLWSQLLPGYASVGSLPWPLNPASSGSQGGTPALSLIDDVDLVSAAATAARIPFVPPRRSPFAIVAGYSPESARTIAQLEALSESLVFVEGSSSIAREISAPPIRSRMKASLDDDKSVAGGCDAMGVMGLSFLAVATVGDLDSAVSRGLSGPILVLNLNILAHGTLPIARYSTALPRHTYLTSVAFSNLQNAKDSITSELRVPRLVSPSSLSVHLTWSSTLEGLIVHVSSPLLSLMWSNESESRLPSLCPSASALVSETRLPLPRLPRIRPHLQIVTLSLTMAARLLRSIGQIIFAMHARWGCMHAALLRKLVSLKSSLTDYYANELPSIESEPEPGSIEMDDKPIAIPNNAFTIHIEEGLANEGEEEAQPQDDPIDPFGLGDFAEEDKQEEEEADNDPFGLGGFANGDDQDGEDDNDPFGLSGFNNDKDTSTTVENETTAASAGKMALNAAKQDTSSSDLSDDSHAKSNKMTVDYMASQNTIMSPINLKPEKGDISALNGEKSNSDSGKSTSQPDFIPDEWSLTRREILAALVDGSPSPPLRTFLSEYVDPAYIERISKGSQGVFEEIGAILRSKLQPRVEAFATLVETLKRVFVIPGTAYVDVSQTSQESELTHNPVDTSAFEYSDKLKKLLQDQQFSPEQSTKGEDHAMLFASAPSPSGEFSSLRFDLGTVVNQVHLGDQLEMGKFIASLTTASRNLVMATAQLSSDILSASACQKAFLQWLEEKSLTYAAYQQMKASVGAPAAAVTKAYHQAGLKINAADKLSASLDLQLVSMWLRLDLKPEPETRLGRSLIMPSSSQVKSNTNEGIEKGTSQTWLDSISKFNGLLDWLQKIWSVSISGESVLSRDVQERCANIPYIPVHTTTIATIDDPSDGFSAFDMEQAEPLVENVSLSVSTTSLSTQEALHACPALGCLSIFARQVQLDLPADEDEDAAQEDVGKGIRNMCDVMVEPRTELLDFIEESSEVRARTGVALLQASEHLWKPRKSQATVPKWVLQPTSKVCKDEVSDSEDETDEDEDAAMREDRNEELEGIYGAGAGVSSAGNEEIADDRDCIVAQVNEESQEQDQEQEVEEDDFNVMDDYQQEKSSYTSVTARLGTLPAAVLSPSLSVMVLNPHSIGIFVKSQLQVLCPLALSTAQDIGNSENDLTSQSVTNENEEANEGHVQDTSALGGNLDVDESRTTVENWDATLGVRITFSNSDAFDDVRIVAVRMYGYDKVIVLLRRKINVSVGHERVEDGQEAEDTNTNQYDSKWIVELVQLNVSTIPAQFWKGGTFSPLRHSANVNDDRGQCDLTKSDVISPESLIMLLHQSLSPRIRTLSSLDICQSTLYLDVCAVRGVACVFAQDPFDNKPGRLLILDIDNDDIIEDETDLVGDNYQYEMN